MTLKLKRMLGIFLSGALLTNIILISASAASKVSLEDAVTDMRIDMLEAEIQKANLEIEEKYRDEIDYFIRNAENISVTSVSQADAARIAQTKQRMNKERIEAEQDILKKYGYLECETQGETAVAASVPGDISFYEDTPTYNSTTQTYRYTVDWTFLNQDRLWDTYDIAGVGMTNPSDYYITKSYAKTFSNYGNQTCYVNDLGNTETDQEIFRGCLSKRAESQDDGVAFNVQDGTIPNVCIPAESGRITVYVKKKSSVTGSPENKMLCTYQHNYKTNSLQTGAQISFVDFALSGQLTVSYSHVNGSWNRASGGKFLT